MSMRVPVQLFLGLFRGYSQIFPVRASVDWGMYVTLWGGCSSWWEVIVSEGNAHKILSQILGWSFAGKASYQNSTNKSLRHDQHTSLFVRSVQALGLKVDSQP